ncbi:MAG: hypothetical protein JNJ73_04565 [Hyphomonadaceae bacterium]|nr:hypothetical protein [Hyphomonadaceae bacterium]
MIHVISAANAQSYQPQLEAMHRLRWKAYIEERKWSELREMQAEPGFERDQYDDARAFYLLPLGDDGDVLGSMRLRSTVDGSLLGDRFRHLVDDADRLEPRPDVWEFTRILRAPECRDRDGAVRFAMNCALIEFCLSRGIRRVVASCDSFIFPTTRRAWGRKVAPLGLPKPYPEGEVMALELTPDVEALYAMRQAGGIREPQLYEHPAAYAINPISLCCAARGARASLAEAA